MCISKILYLHKKVYCDYFLIDIVKIEGDSKILLAIFIETIESKIL